MKRIIVLLACMCFIGSGFAQCFEIERILADACVSGTGTDSCGQEGPNEMVRFRIGAVALNTADLTVTWPSNNWLGVCQSSITANKVAAINATILGCGYIKEPVGGVLPANSTVIIVTSSQFCTLANSFANLNDTIYMIFQCAGNTSGHFANYSTGTGLRTLTMSFNPPMGCSDAVTYDKSLLINQSGGIGGSAAQRDGAGIEFDPAGNPTYVNDACQAPLIPLTVNAGADQSGCANTVFNLLATASGQYSTISWSGGTGTFGSPNALGTTYTPGTGESGSVTLTVTLNSVCGTTVTDNVTLTLSPAPVPLITSASGSSSVCQGDSLRLTASGATTYTWTPGNSTASSIYVSAQGTYTVTSGSACGNSSATFSLTVNPLPTVGVSADDSTICSGSMITLTASGANNYSWSSGTSATTGMIVTASPAANTSYTVTGTDGNSCSDTAMVSIVVNEVLVSSSATVTPPSCGNADGAVTGLSVTGSGNYTYSWTDASAGVVSTSSNASSLAAGSYTVTVTDVATGCTGTQVFTLSNSGGIAAPAFVASPSVCMGDNYTLTVSNPLVGAVYTWELAGDTVQSGADLTTITVNNADSANTGIYTVEVNDGSCTSFSTVTVTLAAAPSPVVTGNTGFCPGGNTVLNASATLPGGDTYQWYQNGNPIPGATLLTYTATAAGNYQVLQTNLAGCDSLSPIIAVTVFPNPVISVNGFQNDTVEVCTNADTLLTASGAVSYVWSTSATSATIDYTAATNEVLSVAGTDANGCTDSTHVTLMVQPGPDPVPFFGVPTICNGYQTQLYVIDTIAGQSYTWTNAAGATLSSADSVILHTAGNYTLTVTNGCGSTVLPITIGQSSIDVSFVADTTIGLAPLEIDFTNTSANATGFYWSFGNGDSSYQVSPQTVYNDPGTYTVYLAGSNSAYCYDSYTVTIIVLEMNVFITVPNIFSPNGDDVNDFFGMKSYGIKDFNCLIYDRWGLLVTELKDINEKWAPGLNASEGTYYYIMKAKGLDDQEFEKEGHVLLVR